MPCTYPHDHGCYWAGNSEMAQKTKEYEERAMAIVKRGAFKEGTKHPWMESGFRGDFRVQLFQFQGTAHYHEHSFENPRDLFLHFEDAPKDEGAKIPNRRLIILEDMDPRFVELLGVKLEIPPEFFLAHCEEFVNLIVVDRVCTKQSSSTYWKVPVRQKRCLPRDFQGPYGLYVVEPGSFSRFDVNIVQNKSGYVSFNSLVSYWGKTYDDGSWTAILLVDPYKTQLQLKGAGGKNSENRVTLTDINPVRHVCTEVMIGRESARPIQPYERSLYDAIADAHRVSKIVHTDDPFSATAFARNFIRASWEEYIWWEAMEFHDTLFEDEKQHRIYRGTNALESLATKDNKTAQAYQKFMETRQYVKRLRSCVNGILWSFRCKDSEYLQLQPEKLREALGQEKKEWVFLDEKLQSMEATIGDHIEMYSQRTALEESFAARRQARSAGQLTKLATIIVPCTFVASIFSMGGKFAAGESLFGVYWAVSIPVTLALLAWVLYEDLPWAWKKMSEWGRGKLVTKSWKKALPWSRRDGESDVEKGEKTS